MSISPNRPRAHLFLRIKRQSPLIFLCLIALFCVAAIAFFISFLWPSAQRWGMEQIYPLRYEALILRYSETHNLDPFLVKGAIQAESSFRSEAVSPVGARGLMQIMPSTAAWLAERMGIAFEEADLFNPAYNIRMGTYYLRHLMDLFEHQDTALAAYNAGQTRVRYWLEQERYSHDGETLHTIPYAETREYVLRVNRYMERYRELYGEGREA